jgi:Protein of unknown function (DUF4089)
MAEMDLWSDIIGLDLPPERRAELLAAFQTIAAEIARLRTLDLTDVHPAVVFDPTLGERQP